MSADQRWQRADQRRPPADHPEAFVEAVATVCRGMAADIRGCQEGTPADPLVAGSPRAENGAPGVR